MFIIKEKIIKWLSLIPRNSESRKNFRSFWMKFNLWDFLTDYKHFRQMDYRIVSLGTNCLPRVVCTMARLKPTKAGGELTMPFDICYHNDIEQIVQLLKYRFQNYFEGLELDEKSNYYENKQFSAIYNHDSSLAREEFIRRYTARISNFLEAVKDEKYVFFVLATPVTIKPEVLNELFDVLSELRGDKLFSLIIISHDVEHQIETKNENIFVIYEKNEFKDWIRDINVTPRGKNFYRNISSKVKEIIKKTMH